MGLRSLLFAVLPIEPGSVGSFVEFIPCVAIVVEIVVITWLAGPRCSHVRRREVGRGDLGLDDLKILDSIATITVVIRAEHNLDVGDQTAPKGLIKLFHRDDAQFDQPGFGYSQRVVTEPEVMPYFATSKRPGCDLENDLESFSASLGLERLTVRDQAAIGPWR